MASSISVTLKMIDQMSQIMDNIANSGDRVANNISNFGDRANAAFERASSGSQRIDEAMQSASISTAEYAEQGSRAQQALEEQASSADRAAREVGEFGDEVQEAGNQSEEFGDKASKSAMDLGDALVAAGIAVALKAIADAYNECDEAADTFETAMAKVDTIADTTAVSLDTIKADIKGLSKETGVAVADLSESVYSAISASVDTANAVDFVSQANALAVGGFTQTSTAVDILTTALNAYHLEADQTQNVADMLIMTQNLGKTTVDELASSMGKVIPTANSLNVGLDELCGSYAVMTANGIATAETTTYLNSMLNELGKNGSAAAEAFAAGTEHIKAGGLSMAEAMESGWSLTDVLSILDEQAYETGTTISNLFGSAEAGKAANVLWSNAEKVDKAIEQMGNSAGAANKAFEKMTNTGEYVDQKWNNALNNLKIAIGDAQPSLDGLMERGTVIAEDLTDFIDKHPEVVSGIVAISASLAAFTISMTAYSAATLFAEKATTALTAAMEANPILLAATALAALTVGTAVFVSSLEDAEEAQEKLTGSSLKLSNEIAEQEKTVEALNEKYGENNEKTLEAKAKLNELQAEYEATKTTIDGFNEQIRNTIDAVDASINSYDEATAAFKEQSSYAMTLVAELERLQSQSELTAFQQQYEKEVIEELNEIYPDLGLTYDEVSGKLGKSTEYLKEYCEQKNAERKLELDAEQYVTYLSDREQLTQDMAIAQKNLTDATDEYNRLMDEFSADSTSNEWSAATANMTEYQEKIAEAALAMESAQADVDELTGKMDELQSEIEALGDSTAEAANGINGVDDASKNLINTTDGLKVAMEGIFTNVQEQAEELAGAYQEAYDAAASAVDSSFGLFEKIELQTSQSARDMVEALKSQAEYLDEYSSNLEKAKGYGLDSGLVENLADGSKESAAALDTIISKIEDLGGSTDKAKEYIEDMNTSFKKVEESKKTLEETMVEMNTTLQTKMEDLKSTMESGIENLELSDQAANAAAETMKAYIAEIESYASSAVSSADRVASAVSSALSKTNVKGSIAGHANGTTYGENVYVAGENGPELIVGRAGSEVFPASETAKILSAVMNNRQSSAGIEMAPQEITNNIIQTSNSTSTNTENRNLTLTIKGKGSLDIGQSVSRKDLHNYIQDELEGAIMSILSREMYEEGAIAYEF